jgi:hypothetical protein
MKLPAIVERAKKNIIPVRYLVVLIGLAVLIALGEGFGSALASHVSESEVHGDYVIILVIVGIYVGFLYWAFRKPNPGPPRQFLYWAFRKPNPGSSRQRFIGPGGWLIDTQRVAKSGETDPLGEILESGDWPEQESSTGSTTSEAKATKPEPSGRVSTMGGRRRPLVIAAFKWSLRYIKVIALWVGIGPVVTLVLLVGSCGALFYFLERPPSPPPETVANIEKLLTTNSCERCVFDYADLSGTDLTNAKLTGSIWIASDLSGANLTGANLSFSSFSSRLVNWGLDDWREVKTNLTNINVTNANLRGVDFEASLRNPNRPQVNLSGVDLSTALLCETYASPEFGVINSNRDCHVEDSSHARLHLIPKEFSSQLTRSCVHTQSDGTEYCVKRCRITVSDGTKYCGDYMEDHVFHGKGSLIKPDGVRHIGEFKDGSLWSGVIYNKNGAVTAKLEQGTSE